MVIATALGPESSGPYVEDDARIPTGVHPILTRFGKIKKKRLTKRKKRSKSSS